MNRFFKKSKNIEELSDSDIREFLSKEKLVGRIEEERVRDFYNALSTIKSDRKLDIYKDSEIDYSYFGCKTQEDADAIDQLKEEETSFLRSINDDLITDSRMVKLAVAAAYKFEKMHSGESEDDVNEYLRHIIKYSEEPDDFPPMPFSELIDKDFCFLRYLALLSTKKAFLKSKGKLVRSHTGNVNKYCQMEEFSEIFNMNIIDSAMPNFKRKLAQKDVYVKGRFEKQQKGQNLFIIVDDSGSMSEHEKVAMVHAALYLKWKDTSDVHNVYITKFVRNINKKFLKIEKNTKFEDITGLFSFSCGTTDVDGCIKEVMDIIKHRKVETHKGTENLSEAHFEILVINDGQDSVDKNFHPQIKTHSLCLKQINNDLKNICHRSGGTYFHIE